MAFLVVPEPFDFELTTERFRAFGVDRASLWHEGGLHRVVGGREVRIEAAAGGVEVEPLDAETEPVVRAVLGLPFELEPFYAWAGGDGVLAPVVPRLLGFRPSVAPDPFEMLVGAITSQQVSLFSALAIRNRMIERFGERAVEAWAFPTRARLAAVREEELVNEEREAVSGAVFANLVAAFIIIATGATLYLHGVHEISSAAEAASALAPFALARSDVDLYALAALPDEDVRARLVALRGIGAWTAEWFLARHLARPHAWPAGDLALRKAVAPLDVDLARVRFHPFENLSAHYLLLSNRVP